MTLPKTPTIKIPLNYKDPNQNLLHFHRRLDCNDLLERGHKRQTRPRSTTSSSSSSSSLPSSHSENDAPSPLHPKSMKQQKNSHELLQRERFDLEQKQKKIEPARKQRMYEPKLLHALPSCFKNYRGQEMFITTDTPIFGLPLEIMLKILKYCSTYEDYLEIFFVCKTWRRFMDATPLWEDISIQWLNLKAAITSKCLLPYSDYITTLTIIGTTKKALMNPEIDRIDHKPLAQLRHVRTLAMNIADVKFIIDWMKNIESLHCKDTHCSAIVGANLSRLSELQQLKSLRLSFAETLNLSYNFMRFDLSGNSPKKSILPKTLENFSLHDIYDREQIIMKRLADSRSSVDWDRSIAIRWMALEDALVQKYSMLASLQNLKSLTLGRVSSFTSRVWRECLIPCGSQLEYLSLTGRPEAGQQEPPPPQQSLSTDTARIIDDSEAAISEYFSCLTRIKQVRLHNFHCGVGLIDGISRLDKPHRVEIEGSANERFSISDFETICLFGCRIHMNESREPAAQSYRAVRQE